MFYARPHLIKRKEEEKERTTPNQTLIDDIGTALRFVQEDFESTILSLDSLLASREITWDLIWAICPPKATFLAPRYGLMHQMQAFYVTSSGYEQRPNNTKYYGLYGKIITHDGSDFGWGNISIEIDQFEGARPLTSLDAFPLEEMAEFEAVRDKLVARGRKYVFFVDQPTCLEYAAERATNALGIKETALPDGKLKAEKFNVSDKSNAVIKWQAKRRIGCRTSHRRPGSFCYSQSIIQSNPAVRFPKRLHPDSGPQGAPTACLCSLDQRLQPSKQDLGPTHG